MSHCTHCQAEMSDAEARLFDECPACRHAGVTPHMVKRFQSTGKKIKYRNEIFRPMPWQIGDQLERAQSGD